MSNKVVGILIGLISGLLWGIDTILIQYTTNNLNSIFFNTIHISIIVAFFHDAFSSIYISLICFINKSKIKKLEHIKLSTKILIIISSIFSGPIGMTGYVLAIEYLGVGYSASISATYPIISYILSFFILKDKLNLKKFIGLLFVISSVILISYDASSVSNFYLGIFSIFLCVMGLGFESVVCSYVMDKDKINPIQILKIRQISSSLFYIIVIIPNINYSFSLNINLFDLEFINIILLTSFFGTLSYMFYYISNNKIGAIKSTILNVTYVFWSIILNIIFFDENISLILLFSSILLTLGIITVLKD